MCNYFNIVRSVGLIFFGIGTILVGVTLPEFMLRIGREYRDGFYSNNVWDNGLAAFTILGFVYLIIGLAGLLKAKWFPKGGMLALILTFIVFTWASLAIMIPESHGEELFFAGGVMLVGYAVMACFFLLMNNQYFLEALHEEDDKEEKDERILDA